MTHHQKPGMSILQFQPNNPRLMQTTKPGLMQTIKNMLLLMFCMTTEVGNHRIAWMLEMHRFVSLLYEGCGYQNQNIVNVNTTN